MHGLGCNGRLGHRTVALATGALLALIPIVCTAGLASAAGARDAAANHCRGADVHAGVHAGMAADHHGGAAAHGGVAHRPTRARESAAMRVAHDRHGHACCAVLAQKPKRQDTRVLPRAVDVVSLSPGDAALRSLELAEVERPPFAATTPRPSRSATNDVPLRC